MSSLGLIVLEAAANVVLPDNGLSWQKLRTNDLSDVNTAYMSQTLVTLIHTLLQPEPAARPTASQLTQHSIIAYLGRPGCGVSTASGCDVNMRSGDEQRLSGALVAEPDHFLIDLLDLDT